MLSLTQFWFCLFYAMFSSCLLILFLFHFKFCFNSLKIKPNVHAKLLSVKQNPFSLSVFVHSTGMILLDDFCSQSVFNSILISIISIPYILALCYCFPEKRNHVFHFVSNALVVLAHTIYENFWPLTRRTLGFLVN